MAGNLDVIKKIRAAVGKRVLFIYIADKAERRGYLKDRVVVPSGRGPGKTAVPYWSVIDLIEFDHEPEPWIRITYYRKPKDRLIFAGQTTATFRIREWRKLLLKAASDKPWFRDLVKDVMRGLRK